MKQPYSGAETDDLHPIDIVEHLAECNQWDFDRIEDDQINMAVEGQWRTYSTTLAWSAYDETLRMICTFEMEPPEERMSPLYEGLNAINDQCWVGCFSFWNEQKLMIYKYGLILTGNNTASTEQIEAMIRTAVATSERYYPAFQLMVWTDKAPHEAIQIAIAEAYGHA